MKDVDNNRIVRWSGTVSKKKTSKKTPSCEDRTIEDEESNNYTYPRVNGVTIEDYLPPPSKQKDVLETMLLTLKEAEYNLKNRPASAQDSDDSEDYSGQQQEEVDQEGDAICVDESKGAFKF